MIVVLFRWNMSSILLASICLLLLLDLFTFEMIIISACLCFNTWVDICTHTLIIILTQIVQNWENVLHKWSHTSDDRADFYKVILIFLKIIIVHLLINQYSSDKLPLQIDFCCASMSFLRIMELLIYCRNIVNLIFWIWWIFMKNQCTCISFTNHIWIF